MKFTRVARTDVLFGYFGQERVGESVRTLLAKHESFEDWKELVETVATLLTEDNLQPDNRQDQGTSAMLAGFLSSSAGIVRVDPWGNLMALEDPSFLGNGRVVAEVAWRVSAAIQGASIEHRLRRVMYETCDFVRPLGPPFTTGV